MDRRCYGCCSQFQEGEVCLKCPKCYNYYCETCDAFLHDGIFNCPGCFDKVHSSVCSTFNMQS